MSDIDDLFDDEIMCKCGHYKCDHAAVSRECLVGCKCNVFILDIDATLEVRRMTRPAEE